MIPLPQSHWGANIFTMVPKVRGSRGKSGNFKKSWKIREKSEKVREFYINIPKSGKTQRVRESEGISEYQGAKVNKDAEKIFELLCANCVQHLKIFPAGFVCRLFVPPLSHFFRHPFLV